MAHHPCPDCHAPLVEIELPVGRSHATLRSCSNCEHRSWHGDEGEIELAGVLAALGVDAEAQRQPRRPALVESLPPG